MPEYFWIQTFSAADDRQAARLGREWGGTCAAEYDTRNPIVVSVDGELHGQLAEALSTHCWDDFPRSAHADHNYYAACAICQGDLPQIAAVLMAVRGAALEWLRGRVTRHRNDATRWRAKALGAVDEAERLRAELAEERRKRDVAERGRGGNSEAACRIEDALAEAWPNLREDPVYLEQVSLIAARYAGHATIEQRQRAERAEVERDALKAGIAEAVRQIREWMNPGSDEPLFAPGHAAEVDRTLKKYIGEHVIAALDTSSGTEGHQDARAEVARLRAGEADSPGDPDTWPTPAEWIRRWNDATPEQRLAMAQAQIDLARAAAARHAAPTA